MQLSFLLIAILVFTVINLGFGLFARKKMSASRTNYVAAPNQTGFWLLTTSLSGTIVGGGMFFAVSQIGYEAGSAGYFLGFSYLIGFIILGKLTPKIRSELAKHNSVSLFEYLESKYDSNSKLSPANIFRIASLFLYFMFIAAQFIVLSSFLIHLLPDLSSYSLLFGAVVVFLLNSITYVYLGGIKKDILTDSWQMTLVLFGLIAILMSLNNPMLAFTNVEKAMLFGTGKGLIFLIGVTLFTGPALLIRPDMWQRVITAKSDSVAKNSFYAAGFSSLLFFSIFTFIGMYAKANSQSSSELFLFNLIGNSSEFISLLIILSLFGAVLSSADTFINTASLSLSEFWDSLKPNKDDTIKTLKLSSLFIVLISIVFAIIYKDLVDLFSSGFGLVFIFFPIVLHALFNDKLASTAARFSSISGLVIYAFLVPFMPKEAFLPGFLISVTIFFVVKKLKNKGT